MCGVPSWTNSGPISRPSGGRVTQDDMVRRLEDVERRLAQLTHRMDALDSVVRELRTLEQIVGQLKIEVEQMREE